jgi:hypothetical protein
VKADIENIPGISIKNAGLVLLNSFIPLLFERLGLIYANKFIDTEKQAASVHYLQYTVTGLSHTEDFLLPLNKILCGLPLPQHVTEGISVSEEHKEIIEGLIKAVINYWPAIGDSSIEGFRGNWLVRDGLLTEQDDKWELVVEKRAYDVLIHKSPFSLPIIKYPWMDKPLHVIWPY